MIAANSKPYCYYDCKDRCCSRWYKWWWNNLNRNLYRRAHEAVGTLHWWRFVLFHVLGSMPSNFLADGLYIFPRGGIAGFSLVILDKLRIKVINSNILHPYHIQIKCMWPGSFFFGGWRGCKGILSNWHFMLRSVYVLWTSGIILLTYLWDRETCIFVVICMLTNLHCTSLDWDSIVWDQRDVDVEHFTIELCPVCEVLYFVLRWYLAFPLFSQECIHVY